MATPALRRPRPTDSFGVMSLSLFLLLLAFFILLTAISSFEDQKVSRVMDSIDQTFDTYVDPLITKAPGNAVARPPISAARLFDQVERLFKTEIELAEVRRVDNGRAMIVTVPFQRFFATSGGDIALRQGGIVQQIARELATPPPDTRYELEFITHGPVSSRDLAIRGAGVFARMVAGSGAPAGSLSVGVSAARERSVELRFRVVPRNAPRITFEEMTIIGEGG